MLDIDHGIRWYGDAFTGDLNAKAFALLNAVCQAAQFGDKLLLDVMLFDIAFRFFISLYQCVVLKIIAMSFYHLPMPRAL
jgi:hypothetical protein